MKKIFSFIKEQIVIGIAVLVPIAVVVVVLSGSLKKLADATSPITDNISFGGPLVKTVIASALVILVLAVVFFLSGLLLKSYLGRSFKNWLENMVLTHVPFYDTIKNITSQFTGLNKGKYVVVELSLDGNNSVILGLLTETLSDGRHLVYCPFAPLMNVGQIHIVDDENIKRSGLTLKECTDIITQIGFESDKIYKKKY